MMYSCGHNLQGESVPEYWKLLPHERMPCSSGRCPKCVRASQPIGFGMFIADENAPRDTIFMIPPINVTRHENYATGEVKEVWEWNPKAAGVITSIKKET